MLPNNALEADREAWCGDVRFGSRHDDLQGMSQSQRPEANRVVVLIVAVVCLLPAGVVYIAKPPHYGVVAAVLGLVGLAFIVLYLFGSDELCRRVGTFCANLWEWVWWL